LTINYRLCHLLFKSSIEGKILTYIFSFTKYFVKVPCKRVPEFNHLSCVTLPKSTFPGRIRREKAFAANFQLLTLNKFL